MADYSAPLQRPSVCGKVEHEPSRRAALEACRAAIEACRAAIEALLRIAS